MSDTIFFISVIAGFIVILFVVIRFVKNDAVETNELESDDIARRESVDTLIEELKKKAGKDAQIYSYKTDYEWVCVCSCRNVLDEEKEIQKWQEGTVIKVLLQRLYLQRICPTYPMEE